MVELGNRRGKKKKFFLTKFDQSEYQYEKFFFIWGKNRKIGEIQGQWKIRPIFIFQKKFLS
jgi:hypothetical protein